MSFTRRRILITIAVVTLLVTTPMYLRRNSAAEIPNSPPVAVDDSYTVHGIKNIGPFLANDYDPDGDSKFFHEFVTYPTHGSFGGGTYPDVIGYFPAQGYVGPESQWLRDWTCAENRP
jgi:hypothetical protein